MKIAGLDIGTTGCKCTVFDEQGKYLDKAYRDYPVRRAIGGHEVDVSVIMDGVYAVLGEMAKLYPDIAGIGVTSFGETFVMTDETGKPLHTAMLYTDPRGKEECEELIKIFGAEKIAEMTGLRPHEMYSISKMMWLKKNHPEVYEKASYIFLMEDFVVYHLTGKRQIDYSLATRTMAFDIEKLTWQEEIFQAAGIDVHKMSEVVPTGTDAGTITEEAAKQTGLGSETHIVSVSHDQVAAAVGAGAFDSSVAVDGAGTAADIYRGCMEGVVYEMLVNVQALKGSGCNFKKMHATGGGAHSKEWMQMKADMLNIPIVALKTVDAGTVGSAMLTGIAIGVFKDLEDAAAHMVEETNEYLPRKEMHEKYLKIFERYSKVYQAVRPLM